MKASSAVGLLAVFLLVPVAVLQPLEGTWEGEIEDPRRPTVVTADFEASTASLSGAAPVPLTRRTGPSDAATVEFEVHLGPQTLRFTGTRTGTRIKGLVETGTRQLPFWLERLPGVTAGADRVTAWRGDLDVVLTRFLRYDRSIDAARRSAIRARLEKLKASVGGRSDAAIVVELARGIAMGGNAHTRLYLVRNRTEVRRLPVRLWWFRDELRVVRAAPEHVDLLGCRVIRIGGLDVLAAFRRVRDVKAGNTQWQRYMGAYFLASPDILLGAGVIEDAGRVRLTVACDSAQRQVDLAPLPLRRSSSPVEAWWDLLPAYPHPEPGLISALTADKAPRYLRNAHQNCWFEYLPELSAIYIQYNRAQQMSADPMNAFIERVARAVDEGPLKALVIDVRFNTGGDAGVGTPLVKTLAAKVPGVPAFVLTGRATFSAGITHAAQWKQLAGATVIGERAGDALDMWAEGGNLVLPHSKLTVHHANGFHTYSPREYPQFRPYFGDLSVASLEPEVIVEPSWLDYSAGRDPVLEAVAARVGRGAR